MSTSHIVIAPLLVVLVTAVLTLITRNYRRVQRTLSLLGIIGYGITVYVLVRTVMPANVLAYQLSGWPAPYGITLVADALSAFMLGFTAFVSICVLVYALYYVDAFGQQVAYHPLFHFMLVGVTGAFLTADIFNMFVWFEVMLMSSYILVVLYSSKEQTRAALQYVVLNLVGSALMLLAIGGIYATTGTLNMADLAIRLADPAAYGISVPPVLGLSVLLFAVFALKAGIVPFQFWVPATYSAAPAPVSAMLAGVTKKVGIYAIIRLYFTVFAAATLPDGLLLPFLSGNSILDFFGPFLFIMATASILVGGLGAVSREDLDQLLAYSSIGQVGFIVLPLAIAATIPAVRSIAVAAALIYILNHAVVKSMLFLISGTVYQTTGTTRFTELGGLAEKTPLVAAAFFIGALSLIGIPPVVGFFSKLLVFTALTQGVAYLALGVALAGAVLTILYFSRGWNSVFWGSPMDAELLSVSRIQIGAVLTLAAATVLLGIGFEVVLDAAMSAADAVLQPEQYIETVLGGDAH